MSAYENQNVDILLDKVTGEFKLPDLIENLLYLPIFGVLTYCTIETFLNSMSSSTYTGVIRRNAFYFSFCFICFVLLL